jgi:Fe-Mn family superoxide dismutase
MGKALNQWAADHCDRLAGGVPMFAPDMYEHSYHIDLGAKSATSVNAFVDVFHWVPPEDLVWTERILKT